MTTKEGAPSGWSYTHGAEADDKHTRLPDTPATTRHGVANDTVPTTERKVIPMPEKLRIGSLFSGY